MAIEQLNNYKKVRYSNVDIINNVMEKNRELVGFIFRNNNSCAFDYCTFFILILIVSLIIFYRQVVQLH